MYIPEHFAENDWATAAMLIKNYSFAQLISVESNGSIAADLTISHIPVLYDEEQHQLLFHLAAANPHNHDLQDKSSTLIFNGPHGYISPNWSQHLIVPTWNYAAVHIKGLVNEVVEDDEKIRLMNVLSAYYEKPLTPAWSLAQLNAQQQNGMLKAIRCYVMSIDSWQAKLKLSQNRSTEGVEQVAQVLMQKSYPNQDNQALAQLMLKQNI